jgi:hypothetical protein
MDMSDHDKLQLLQMLGSALEKPGQDITFFLSVSRRISIFRGLTHLRGSEAAKVAKAADAVISRAAAMVNTSEVRNDPFGP